MKKVAFFYSKFHLLVLLYLIIIFDWIYAQQFPCNIFDLACQQRLNQQQQYLPDSRLRHCNYQDIWLIPGKSDTSCCMLLLRVSHLKFVNFILLEIKFTLLSYMRFSYPPPLSSSHL